MDKNKYIDNVLIKLKRQYSKDEYVSVLLKKYSELEIEKGIMATERDEAIFNLEKHLKLPCDVKSRIGQRNYYRNQIVENKALKKRLKKLKINNEKLFNELVILKNQ